MSVIAIVCIVIDFSSFLLLSLPWEDVLPNCDLSFVCVEVLRPSQPSGVMTSAVSLPNQTFYWAGLVL